MADTTARSVASSEARYRCRTFPKAGTVRFAPASSSRRPIIRNVQSPRRHRPNRSAGAGSCSPPAATACAGRSRSIRGRRCAAAGAWCWRNPDSAGNEAMSSCAACRNHKRGCAQFQSKEPGEHGYLRHTWQISGLLRRHRSKGPMDDTDPQGYRFDNASMTESRRVELGPLPLLVYGAWGKEPN
jgi:hypothetical protein